MKKIVICSLVVSIALMTGCASTMAASNESQKSSTEAAQVDISRLATRLTSDANTSSAQIGEAAAKQIALSHAGLTEAEVTFIKSKLDYDDGRTVYDIEFYVGNTEYDYEIDAYTGSILSYDYDIESYAPSVSANAQGTTAQASTTASSATQISEASAKEIALKHANLTETEVTFITCKLDYDDGYTVYDVEFYAGSTEYDFEIDAYTGDIRSYDYDIDSYSIQSAKNNDSSYISLDEAKTIALNKAGLSSDKVSYTEASFEYEDGVAVYQIKFISGRMEYEFEINAVSGAIMECDFDYD